MCIRDSSYITSLSAKSCEEYIINFAGCKCFGNTNDKKLYGTTSFNVTCQGIEMILSVYPMDNDSRLALMIREDPMIAFYSTKINDYLNHENEFIVLKDKCPFGSIETQIKNGLKLHLNKSSKIVSKIIEIAKYFEGKDHILTNLNVSQICLDAQKNPIIFDIRGAKRIKGLQRIDSDFQYLPPEYFQSYTVSYTHLTLPTISSV